MSENVVISRIPPARESQNYAALREHGMEFIRQLAKESWTDHNIHDPGITLLEAFCYAMTELGLRIQLDIPDLLQSGTHSAPPDLVPTHHVLPGAPVTLRELRKVLLDHPLLKDARLTAKTRAEVPFFLKEAADPHAGDSPYSYESNGSKVSLRGLYSVVLEFLNRDLNSNAYTLTVTPAGYTDNYTLDISMTHWNEDVVGEFQHNPAVNSIALYIVDGIGWRPLPESQSYFGEIDVDIGGVEISRLWILFRIVEDVPISEPRLLAGILDAAQTAVQQTGTGSLIDQFGKRVQAAYEAVQQIQQYLSNWRNLCEEPVRIEVARMQEIAVHARVEISGSTNLEQLLADIFLDIDRLLAPRTRFQSLEQRRAAGDDVDRIYDGPLLRSGFLEDDSLAPDDTSVIYTSDILRIIMRHRSKSSGDVVSQENPSGREIVAVTDLKLSNYINNRPITIDVKNCLHLVEVERYRPRLSLNKSRITFVRNDTDVPVDELLVTHLFKLLRETDEMASMPNPSPIWQVTRGEVLPVEDYIPLQNDLPKVYGVGEARLPDSISKQRQAATLQLKGYLLLFEQFLADLTAQLGNINRFFSANPDEQATYFSRALFELPDVHNLLLQFPLGSDWEDWLDFIEDPDNPYANALQHALEGQQQFLDRRNRMLDHLLARQGEDMVAYSQELHRYAQKELLAAEIDSSEAPLQMQTRRQAANARLIRAKAALLYDVPQLNATRLQAFGNPLHRRTDILQIELDGSYFRWNLTLEGKILLRSVNNYPSRAAALGTAEEAVVMAAQESYYITVKAGRRRRYQLQDNSGLTARVIAEGPQTYASDRATRTAALVCAQQFRTLRFNTSLTPMEQRINHLCGIHINERRRLLTDLDEFFEIYDEVDSDGIIEKRWRLWEYPERKGRVMLSSVYHFEDSTDAEAEANAKDSLFKVLRYGHDEWNYTVSPANPDTYNFDLRDSSGKKIGIRIPPLPSEAATREAIRETVSHLYRHYSAEGFHLVEHLLLRPRQLGDEFLSLPDGPDAYERDPYSQRLSLVFPSGYMRNFSIPADDTTEPDDTAPHRFRDNEFRHHVKCMVRQACPAHILPSIYWVDRQMPNTSSSNDKYSFDDFEQAYFKWLITVLIPGSDSKAIHMARNTLVLALNGVANG